METASGYGGYRDSDEDDGSHDSVGLGDSSGYFQHDGWQAVDECTTT